MAITFDASSSVDSGGATTTSSLTWGHTIGNISNGYLIVGVDFGNVTAVVNSVSWNGTSMTKIGDAKATGSQNEYVALYGLANPSTGSHFITVTLNTSTAWFAGAMSFGGVDQTNSTGSFVSANGTSASPTVTVTDANVGDYIVDTLGQYTNAAASSAGSNQVVAWNVGGNLVNNEGGGGSYKPAPGGSTTMSWTLGSSNDWMIGAVKLKASGTTRRKMVLIC